MSLFPRRARRFVAGVCFYLANHVVSRIPSFTIRHAYYRSVLGIRIGRDSALHMGLFVTGRAISVGDNVVINRGCYLDGRVGVRIADNVSVSPGVYIMSLEHDPDSPTFEARGAPVVVERNCWIGAKALILPGVTLGEGSIVGAGAVVTRSIAPNRIAVGVPAREIRDRRGAAHYRLRYFTWFDTDVDI
jgi:acetyltransferase-like isoleucine patch superfamily enzyme